MIAIQKEILGKFEVYKQEIRAFGVKRIGLFGSFVKGSFHPKSDLDVLVEFEQGQKTFDHFMDLKFFLQRRFRKKIDLVIKDSLKPAVRHKVLREVLYATL